MFIIADISMVPIGVEASISRYIKEAHKVFIDADLNARLYPFSTLVEGEYEDVTKAIEKAVKKLYSMGVPRVTMTIKIGARQDKLQTADDKVKSVIEKLKNSND